MKKVDQTKPWKRPQISPGCNTVSVVNPSFKVWEGLGKGIYSYNTVFIKMRQWQVKKLLWKNDHTKYYQSV